MRRHLGLLLALALRVPGISLPAAESVVVPMPAIPAVPTSAVFQLRVNGREVPVNAERAFDFHTAAFSMSGPVKIEITLPPGAESPVVRPRRHRIAPTVDGRTLAFSLDRPLKLVVQVKGHLPLALFATPLQAPAPSPTDPAVIYFGPGLHEPGVIKPRSGQTIYLAPGALVRGRIEAQQVSRVRVSGRGVLDASRHSVRADKTHAILFDRCSDIAVDGIGVRGGSWWQVMFLLTDRVRVADLNIMGVTVNSDGIDLDGVRDFVARDCFIRCEDDGFGWHALDAKTNGEPPTADCLAEDCVIWNTKHGNGLRVGASMETQRFENITFRRIDVLEHANAAIRSDHSDWALCKNIRFEHFTDESSARTVEIVIAKTRYSNATGYRDERGRYEGLHFSHLISPGGEIILRGFDANHRIDHVTFENCVIGGRPVASRADLVTNEFVTNVSFRPAR